MNIEERLTLITNKLVDHELMILTMAQTIKDLEDEIRILRKQKALEGEY